MKNYPVRFIIFFVIITVVFCCGSCKKSDKSGILGIVVPIGQERVSKNRPYMITGVYEASPAYDAGIRPDDKIIKVNGVAIDGLQYDYIYNNLLRGPAGGKVTIAVERNGKLLEYDVVRRK